MHKHDINKILKLLDFSEKEIAIYLELLKRGRSTPALLSKVTRISRPTVYNVIKDLQSKGVIAEDLSGKTMNVTALPPKNLENMLWESKKELKEKEDLVKEAINKLSLLSPPDQYPVPKIRFVEEGDLEKYLYDNIDKWQKAALDKNEAVWGFQDDYFASEYGEWLKYGWTRPITKNKNYRVCHLTNASDFEFEIEDKIPEEKRAVKYVKGINFTSSMWVAGDYLIMVVTKQHPFYLLEIHDETLAHNNKEVLKKLWEKT